MSKLRSLCLGLLVLSCWMAPVAWANPKASHQVISGWVRVGSEDNRGKVLSVEIVVGEAPTEEPYLVNGAQQAALEQLIGEWVVASGEVQEDALGWKTIKVDRFTKVDDLPQPTFPSPSP